MVKTLNNILSLVNGYSEEMRTVSLWGKMLNDRGKAVLYIRIMAGIVQRVELTATSVSEHLPRFHIIIITGHCIKCQCLMFSSTATVALNSTYTRAKQRTHNQPWFKQRALWFAEKSPEKDCALWLVYLFSWMNTSLLAVRLQNSGYKLLLLLLF